LGATNPCEQIGPICLKLTYSTLRRIRSDKRKALIR
jgi:hypothetical protein